MKKDVMVSAGLEIYAVIALIIFVAVFVAVIVRASLLSKEEAGQLNAMPLADDGTVQAHKEKTDE